VTTIAACLAVVTRSAPGADTPAPAHPPQPTSAAQTQPIKPTTRPLPNDAKLQANTKLLFDYLIKEYSAILDRSKDRLGKSVALVCLSQVPRDDVNAVLLRLLKSEPDPLVEMTAWQCLLARSSSISPVEYKQWLELTKALSDRGEFRGDLRVGLLHLLAAGPPDARARDQLARCFATCNSQDIADLPTLIAIGETVRAWGDRGVVESFLNCLSRPDDALRAEAVLHAAGCDVQYAEERWPLGSQQMWRTGLADYAVWWQREKPRWVATKTPAEAWRTLPPQYVPRVDFTQPVDPDDAKWRKELELRPPNFKTFDLALLVDATGSMGEVLAWLRTDVKRILEAMALVSSSPRVGITFYRDFGDQFVSKSIPLTNRPELLAQPLNAMTATGGGDIPEAIREALIDCIRSNDWVMSKDARKTLMVIGDAPPHPETQAECEQIVKEAATHGFRLYSVKVTSGLEAPDLSALDRLAAAGGGSAFEADLRFGLSLRVRPDCPENTSSAACWRTRSARNLRNAWRPSPASCGNC
jgi:hypothetical protein